MIADEGQDVLFPTGNTPASDSYPGRETRSRLRFSIPHLIHSIAFLD